MMSTVGVYAAGLGGTPTIKTIGGTGSTTVTAPTNSAMTLDWTFTGNDVTGVDVTWTPGSSTTYDLVVTAGGNQGTLTTPTTVAGTPRTDSVTLSATDPDAISTAEVVIKEN
jgi:hypothetical protein